MSGVIVGAIIATVVCNVIWVSFLWYFKKSKLIVSSNQDQRL